MNKRAISPTIHGDNISRHFLRDPATREEIRDDVLDGLRSVMTSARQAAEQIVDAHERIVSNKMQTPLKNAALAREKAFDIFGNVAPRFDSARKRAVAELAELEKKMAPPQPKDAMQQMRELEIRQALAAMPAERRKKEIAQAIEQSRESVIVAVVNQDPLALDMSTAEQAMLLHSYKAKRFGPELNRISRIKAAIDDLDRGSATLLSLTDSLTDSDEINRATATEKAASVALKGAA
jgi:hypothetical protein